MLKLNRQLQQIEEMTNHYENELNSVSSQIQSMEEGLIQFYRYKSMDNELSKKLEGLKLEITNRYSNSLSNSLKELKGKQTAYYNQISKYEEYRNNKKEEFKEPLNKIRKERDITFDKLESYGITKDFNPVYTEQEIQQMTLGELNSYLGEVYISCKDIQDVNMNFIPTNQIDPEMWFLANRLNTENKTAVDLARAVNVIAILALTGKFSSIIFGGITAFTAFTIVKNKKALKPIKQYKDFIYTAYNNESSIEGKIDNIVDNEIDVKIKEIEDKLDTLKEKELEITNKSNLRMKQELEEAEDLFHRDLDKHTELIEQDMKRKLEELTSVAKKMETGLKDVFDNILFELQEIEMDIRVKISEANQHELNIINDNTLLDLSRIHLGKEIENNELNRFENLPFGSYLFIYDEDREGLQKLLMYIAVQMAGRIRGDLMKFNIIDSVDFGKGINLIGSREMNMFYSSSEVNELVDLQINKFTEDVKNVLLGHNHIVEYNRGKDATGSALYPYTMNIIQNLDIFSDTNRYRQLLRTTQSGVINLVMMSKNMMLKAQKSVQDSQVDQDEFLELLNLFPVMFNDVGNGHIEMDLNEFYSVESISEIDKGFEKIIGFMNTTIEDSLVDINILANDHELEEVVLNTYELKEDEVDEDEIIRFLYEEIEEEKFRKYGDLVAKNIKNASVTLYYFDDLMDRVGKQLGDGFFSREPTSGVEFPIGYENGDVDKIFEIPFNDYHIHAFMGGRTGMGKSNMSNVGLNSALYLYSPEALNVYYLDGKQAEGAKYMRNVTPHFKCLATTSDPDYLLSLFESIFKEMVWRQKVLLAEYNAGKLGDIREKYYDYIEEKKRYEERGEDYDKYIEEKFNGDEKRIKEFKGTKVAEILIVVDELSEILKGDDPEVIGQILKYIDSFSALGRATGVHLWLMSQGVPDKLDASTMGQVVTRLALPVSTGAISKSLVGNESAADPDYQGKGNLLFNDKGGDLDSNVRIKVPIIQPDDMDKNLGEIVRRGNEAGFPTECVVFDFEEVVTFEDNLLPFLDKNKQSLIKEEYQKIVVGDNVLFTDTPAPVGFDLGSDEGDNIVILSQSSKKRIELTNTVISNFAKVGGENTYLLIYRGNKDFQHLDYADKYKDDFRDIIELEELDEFMAEIKNQPLKKLEGILRTHGLSIINKLDDIESQNADIQPDLYILESLVGIKPQLVDFIKDIGVDTNVSNKVIDSVINYMRPSVPKNILLVEGVERIVGLGVGLDYTEGDTIKDAMLTAPYYNMHIIFTSSIEPQSFSRLEACFRHALLGNLDIMALSKYKFMKDAPDLYCGYANNIALSSNFKYKVFGMDYIRDDVQDDPRIIV